MSKSQVVVLDELIAETKDNITRETILLREGIANAVRGRGDMAMLRKVNEAANLLIALVDIVAPEST